LVEHVLKLIDDYKDPSEVPRIQRRIPKRSLVYYEETTSSRNDAIMRAYKSGGYTMKDVGEFFGLGYSMVSRIVRNSQFKT
jgi:putative transposase